MKIISNSLFIHVHKSLQVQFVNTQTPAVLCLDSILMPNLLYRQRTIYIYQTKLCRKQLTQNLCAYTGVWKSRLLVYLCVADISRTHFTIRQRIKSVVYVAFPQQIMLSTYICDAWYDSVRGTTYIWAKHVKRKSL